VPSPCHYIIDKKLDNDTGCMVVDSHVNTYDLGNMSLDVGAGALEPILVSGLRDLDCISVHKDDKFFDCTLVGCDSARTTYDDCVLNNISFNPSHCHAFMINWMYM
jgi:hypothetical protein